MATTFPPLPGWREDPYYEKREAFDQAVKIAINAAEAGLLLKANSADLEPVAFSGEYDDLTGKPAPVDLAPYAKTADLTHLPGATIATTSTVRPTARADVTVIFKGGDPGAAALAGDIWLGTPPSPADNSPLPVGVMTGGNDGGTGVAGGVHSLSLPGGLVAGQVAIVHAVANTISQTASISSGSEGEWTLLSGPDQSAASTNFREYVWTKTLVGTDIGEPVVVTWSSAVAGVACGVIYPDGVTVGTPVYATVAGGTSSITPAGVLASAGDTLVTFVTAKANSGAAPQTPTLPSGAVADQAVATAQASATNYGTTIAHLPIAAAGTAGVTAITMSGSTNGLGVYNLLVSP